MADSYAALLGMGSSAAAMLTESGRCVEDYFLSLFVVLVRLFIHSSLLGGALLAARGGVRECVERCGGRQRNIINTQLL
jgi:hypothetical protein